MPRYRREQLPYSQTLLYRWFKLCSACVLCNQFGTDGGNSTCDAIDGSCKCKQNVEGKYCNRCKVYRYPFIHICSLDMLQVISCLQPGFYGFGFSNPGGCVACECSNSTAQSSNCDLITGQCQCRKGLSRRTCNESLPGQYVAFLEGPIYEAETAELHVKPSLELVRQQETTLSLLF